MENTLRRLEKKGEGTRYPSMSKCVLNTLQRMLLDFNIVIKHNFEKNSFCIFSRLTLAQHCGRDDLKMSTAPNNPALTSNVSPQNELMTRVL